MDLADPIQPYRILKGHNGSITSLSLHHTRNNILLSGSNDRSIKIWDINTMKEVENFNKFNDEIHNIKWHPTQESVFISHSGKNNLDIFDLKTSSNNRLKINNNKNAEIDNIIFNENDENSIIISYASGQVNSYDMRKLNKALFGFKAHSKNIPGLVMTDNKYLITNSLDSSIKIWDVNNFENNSPKLLKEKKSPIKELYISSVHPENPYLFACGVTGSELVIWDFYSEVVKGEEVIEPELNKEQDDNDDNDIEIEE